TRRRARASTGSADAARPSRPVRALAREGPRPATAARRPCGVPSRRRRRTRGDRRPAGRRRPAPRRTSPTHRTLAHARTSHRDPCATPRPGRARAAWSLPWTAAPRTRRRADHGPSVAAGTRPRDGYGGAVTVRAVVLPGTPLLVP